MRVENQAAGGILDEFRLEFLDCWRRLPNRAFFFILMAAWLALFHFVGNSTMGYIRTPSLWWWMYYTYNPTTEIPGGAEDSYCELVPLIVLVLFWLKRKELLSLQLQSWWPGLVLVALGLVLHIGSYVVQQPKLSILSMLVGLYGLMGLAWGWRFLRASFFPFFLLVFCVPLGSAGQGITWPLRLLVAKIVTVIAHIGLAPGLVRQGTMLLDAQSAFQYDIAPACSGIRSIASLLALTIIYGVLYFKQTWKRLLIVAAAFPLAIIGNVARLTVTVAVAEIFGQDAGSRVETNMGFVTFGVALVCMLVLGHWLREKPPVSTAITSDGKGEPAPAPLTPLASNGKGEPA